MFNYKDVEDDIEDRRPLLEGGLADTDDQTEQPNSKAEQPNGKAEQPSKQAIKPIEPPTIIKKEERLYPAFPYSRRRKFYTKGTQLSVFEAREQ